MTKKIINIITIVFFWLVAVQTPAFSEILNSEDNSENDVWTYTVVKGDYLQAVLNACCEPSLKPAYVAEYNKIPNIDFIAPGQLIRIPVSFLKSKPMPISVLVSAGDALVKRHGTTDYQKLNNQEAVSEGDLIKTGNKSVIRLKFDEESVLMLHSNSLLSIESSRQVIQSDATKVKVKLLEGRAEVKANPKHEKNRSFEVQTPTAVAVVRGTEFRVGAQDVVATEETLNGAVDFKVGDALVAVLEDFGSTATGGQAPTPPMPLPDMPKIVNPDQRFEYLPVELQIAPQQDVVEFVVQMAKDEAFNALVYEGVIPASLEDDKNLLAFEDLPDGDYFLKLRAKDVHGLESRDAIQAFKVDAYPYPPVPIFQQNDAQNEMYPAVFRWTALSDAAGYIIQFAKDEAFNDMTLERFVAYNQFVSTQALPAESRYWRVAAKSQAKQKFSKIVKINH